jgi:hypothetical protein
MGRTDAMLPRLKTPCERCLPGASLALALILVSSSTLAQRGAEAAVGPFTGLNGSWSGGGTITFNKGDRERIRCRSNYETYGNGNAVRLELRCASDSYRFELRSNVINTPGGLSGQWTEETRNAAGTVSGRVTGDHIEALVDGAGFSANVGVTTRGDRQSVTIRTLGESGSQVAITLTRGAR